MRTFKQIYPELKDYSAFTKEPSTTKEAIISINVFFTEIADDFGFDAYSDEYEFLVKSYRHSVKQFILNFKTDKRSFKEYLESIYENLQVKEAV